MKKVTIAPAEQKVVILPEKADDRIGRIFIPATSEKEAPRIGTVVSTGTCNIDNPMKYFVGQQVMFSKYSGLEVELNLDGEPKTYLVMNQMDIMMVIYTID